MAAKYSILLPTCNELENLPMVYDLIMKYMDENDVEYEVIIFNDDSPDGDAALQLQKKYGKTKVLLCPRVNECDPEAAYAHGVKHATGNYIILMDSAYTKLVPELEDEKDFD